MKLLILISLLSTPVWADFVHLTLDGGSHQILLTQEEGTKVVNHSTEKLVLYPDITPDGKELIYVTGPDHQNLSIKYKNLIKGDDYQLSLPHSSMIVHPNFSHNGEFIFYSAQDTQGVSRIYAYPLKEEIKKNKGATTLSLESATNLSPGEIAFFPRPSSDGNFLVYQRNSKGKKEIIFFDRISNIKEVIAEGMSPALSFDEQLIAYAKEIQGQFEIFIFNRRDKTHTRVTHNPNQQMSPTFKPDNTLVFTSLEEGLFNIYELNNGAWKLLAGGDERSHYSPQFSGETKFKQDLKAPFLGLARSSFGTTSYESKVYMAGGHSGAEHTYPPQSFQDTFASYDKETNQWTELTPRPVKAHGYQIIAHEGYIYAFGGFAYSADHKPGWKSLAQIDRYSIKDNKWETVGQLGQPRSSNVVILIEDKAYIVGGWDATPKSINDFEGKFHTEIEIFDFKTLKSTLAPYKLQQKRRALTGLKYQNKILLIGGLGEGATHFELQDKVTMIDPLTGEHRELAQLPFATFAPAAEIIGDELYVFGGMYQTGPSHYEYVSHIYGMKLKTLKWHHTGRFLRETKGFSQVFKLTQDTVGILGGHRYFEGFDSPVSTFETFTK